jgi:hypothetical protein
MLIDFISDDAMEQIFKPMALGKTDESTSNRFQLILLYTGGADFNEGVSHLEEVYV